jgi:mercuric ion transport protein
MAEPTQPGTTPRRNSFRAPLLLAGGGAAAGFFAASCCALPVLLGSAGLGSGWLITLVWLWAPHRIFLLIAAVILLAGGAGAFLWRRRVAHCAVRASAAGLVAGAVLAVILVLGSVLVLLGFLYA